MRYVAEAPLRTLRCRLPPLAYLMLRGGDAKHLVQDVLERIEFFEPVVDLALRSEHEAKLIEDKSRSPGTAYESIR